MMAITLDEIIKIAGFSLESEDRYMIGCSSVNGNQGGILRFANERYYQFVVCRGWLSRWNTVPEQNLHDAVIMTKDKQIATVEMKFWKSVGGEREIPSIKYDIEKLKIVLDKRYLIIFSSNPSTMTEDNIRFLSRECNLSKYKYNLYIFPTISPYNPGAHEFWVAGWQIE